MPGEEEEEEKKKVEEERVWTEKDNGRSGKEKVQGGEEGD